jgi:1-acyl-sn-glycerol-3-phosphate acyltransferase
MRTNFSSLYYYAIRLYVATCCHLYFRRLKFRGLENIPGKGPLIYSINHQNSLLDAFVCNAASKRDPYFLTRGDVFKNKYIAKFLRSIKMLPIYRTRDGTHSIRKNEQVFKATEDILTAGGLVAVFPEGSHSLTHRLRPLKKGIARMAFGAEAAADFQLNVQIVPVGISYESYFSPGGRTLVCFGKPLKIADYKQSYAKNEKEAYRELLADLHKHMKSLIVHIAPANYQEVLRIFREKRVYKSSLKNQLQADQALVDAIETGQPFKETDDQENIFLKSLKYLARYLRWAISLLPRQLVNFLVSKTVKDAHFIATLKFSYSMLIYPLYFVFIYLLFIVVLL